MKLEFKQEMFGGAMPWMPEHHTVACAAIANQCLNEMLAKAQTVYLDANHEDCWWGTDSFGATHTGKIVCIEEVKK